MKRRPYHDSTIANADLYNCRDGDLLPGGNVHRGDLVAGKCGFAVAMTKVPNRHPSHPINRYLPNRCVEWEGFYLTCMALPGLPEGRQPRGPSGGLRHKHYVVAELTGPAIKRAEHIIKTQPPSQGQLRFFVTPDGKRLANLEIASIPGKKPGHRIATLL